MRFNEAMSFRVRGFADHTGRECRRRFDTSMTLVPGSALDLAHLLERHVKSEVLLGRLIQAARE